MPATLTKDSIDLGIVVKDADAALRFYRDTLGFKDQGTMPMPGGGTMYRLLCGSSLIKLVALAQAPAAAAAPGGIQGGTGYRYWTISVSNLDETAERLRRRRLQAGDQAARDPPGHPHRDDRGPRRQLGRAARGGSGRRGQLTARR